MSDRLLKELQKVKFANIQQINENTFIANKDTRIRVEENKCYLIKLNNSIFNPNSVLTSNWNNGRIPKSQYYLVEVNTIMVNMIKVTGIGYLESDCKTIQDNWWGWLPLDEIEVIKKV